MEQPRGGELVAQASHRYIKEQLTERDEVC